MAVAPAMLSAGAARTQPAALARWEGGEGAHAYRHHEPAAASRRYRAELLSCRSPAFRARHWAACPASSGPRPVAPGTQQAAEAPLSATGRWGDLLAVPSLAIHAVVLPTGKVLWFSKVPENEGGRAYLYDPAAGTTTEVPIPSVTYPDGQVLPANLWCGGQAQLPDGRILIAGGNLSYPWGDAANQPQDGRGFRGASWTFLFDPWTETFTRGPDLAHGRWYPTLVSLSDGRVVILGGWDESGHQVDNQDVEVFTPRTTPNGQDRMDVVGHLPASHAWLGLYPHLFLLPHGTVAGGSGADRILLVGPSSGDAAVIDTSDWSWHDIAGGLQLPGGPRSRSWGTAVLEPGGPAGPTRVTLLGGSDTDSSGWDGTAGDPVPTATTQSLDLNDPGFASANPDPTWIAGPPLNHARSHFDTVLLPDGSEVTLGGGYGEQGGSLYAGPVFTTELRTTGGTWVDVGNEDDARTYHSTAVLLPDGRVLSAGDDRTEHLPAPYGTGQPTAQIYSPPYLFDGARPTITSAPAAARYGATFTLGVGDPSRISRVVLMRPAAVTHANDMDQRSVELPASAGPAGLTVTAPADGTVAPPGYYMLFAVDDAGLPSTAAWIRIGADVADPVVPATPTPGVAAPPDGTSTAPAADLGPAVPVHATTTPGLAPLHRRPPNISVRLGVRGDVVRAIVRSDEVVTLRARLVPSPASPRTARLRARRAATLIFRAPSRRRTAELRLVATDAWGNAHRVTRTVALRPAAHWGER
jgi:hypothetical protein